MSDPFIRTVSIPIPTWPNRRTPRHRAKDPAFDEVPNPPYPPMPYRESAYLEPEVEEG